MKLRTTVPSLASHFFVISPRKRRESLHLIFLEFGTGNRRWHFFRAVNFSLWEKPAWTKDFYKSQQPLSIPAWGQAKFPLALLLQLRPARNQPVRPSSGPLRKT